MRSFLLQCAALCLALTAVKARADIITLTVNAGAESGIYYYDTAGPTDWSVDASTGWYQYAVNGVSLSASTDSQYFDLYNTAFYGSNFPGLNSDFSSDNGFSYFTGVQLYTGSKLAPVFTNGVYALNAFSQLGYTDVGTVTISGAPDVAVTPEPSSLLLLGTGIVGMAGMARRRFRTI